MKRSAACAALVLATLVGACSGEATPETTTTSPPPATTTTQAPATTTTAAPTTTTATPATTLPPETTTTTAAPAEPVDLLAVVGEDLAALPDLDVHFAVASDELDDTAVAVLTDIAEVLRATPGVEIVVIGHTDASGADRTNRNLALDRAESVKRWLSEEGGVFGDLISIDGPGPREPIADNATEEGRALNRRAEVTLPESRDRGLTVHRWEDVGGASLDGFDLSAPPDFVAISPAAYGPPLVCDDCITELAGVLIPPESGTYTIFLTASEAAQLWLSDSEDPAGLELVHEITAPVAFDDFENRAAASPPLELEGGRLYAIAVRSYAGEGDDYISLGWTTGRRRTGRIPARGVDPIPSG